MSLFVGQVVIYPFFFRYFSTGFETKAASSFDSNDFIFILLIIDLRALRIEAVDRLGIDFSTANHVLILTRTR
jgi:hypothetical protein